MPLSLYILFSTLDIVNVGSKQYNLIEVVKPIKGDYLQLETITENKSYVRAIHVIQMNSLQPQIKIGRGHDADLRIEDISVSRVHALITLTSEGYMLEDNESKFGTLFLLGPGQHEIPNDKSLFLQYSRTTLGFSIKENLNPKLIGTSCIGNPEMLTNPLKK